MGHLKNTIKMLIFNIAINGKGKKFDVNDKILGTSTLAKIMNDRYMHIKKGSSQKYIFLQKKKRYRWMEIMYFWTVPVR